MANPAPLLQLTVILSVRVDSPERLANFKAVSSYLLDHIRVAELIVVECDKQPQLLDQGRRERTRYMFVQQPDLWVWNRGRVLNTALHWVDTPAVAAWDTDGLISREAVVHSLRLLRKKEAQVIVPFNNVQYSKADPQLLADAARGTPFARDISDNLEFDSPHNLGLVTIFDTATLKHVRGYSELMVGWGVEDSELMARISKLGISLVRLREPARHLHHPRKNSLPHLQLGDHAEAEYARTIQMTAEEVCAYYGITLATGRYSQLKIADPLPTLRQAAEHIPGSPADTPGVGHVLDEKPGVDQRLGEVDG